MGSAESYEHNTDISSFKAEKETTQFQQLLKKH